MAKINKILTASEVQPYPTVLVANSRCLSCLLQTQFVYPCSQPAPILTKGCKHGLTTPFSPCMENRKEYVETYLFPRMDQKDGLQNHTVYGSEPCF